MAKVRVHNLSLSLDGFVAGPEQSLQNPLGIGGEALHDWVFATAYGQAMIGKDGGTTGADHQLLTAGDAGIGATIIGRNMFGPIRGDWPDDEWRGWWGDEPPYHHPVFVLTHYARDPLEMVGGTTFHFVTDGIGSALKQATTAAGGNDVRVGGGASTVRQFVDAGLVDEVHVAIAPVLLGSGERLFDSAGSWDDQFDVETLPGEGGVAHFRLSRRA